MMMMVMVSGCDTFVQADKQYVPLVPRAGMCDVDGVVYSSYRVHELVYRQQYCF